MTHSRKPSRPAAPANLSDVPPDAWDFSALSPLTVTDVPPVGVDVPAVDPLLDQALAPMPTVSAKGRRPSKRATSKTVTASSALNADPFAREALTVGLPDVDTLPVAPSVSASPAFSTPDSAVRTTAARPAVTPEVSEAIAPLSHYLRRPSADTIVPPEVKAESIVIPNLSKVPEVAGALLEKRVPSARAQRGQTAALKWDGSWHNATPDEKRYASRVLVVLVAMLTLVALAVWWAAQPSSPSLAIPTVSSHPVGHAPASVTRVQTVPVVPSPARAAPPAIVVPAAIGPLENPASPPLPPITAPAAAVEAPSFMAPVDPTTLSSLASTASVATPASSVKSSTDAPAPIKSHHAKSARSHAASAPLAASSLDPKKDQNEPAQLVNPVAKLWSIPAPSSRKAIHLDAPAHTGLAIA